MSISNSILKGELKISPHLPYYKVDIIFLEDNNIEYTTDRKTDTTTFIFKNVVNNIPQILSYLQSWKEDEDHNIDGHLSLEFSTGEISSYEFN
jgi:hypothetical protein